MTETQKRGFVKRSLSSVSICNSISSTDEMEAESFYASFNSIGISLRFSGGAQIYGQDAPSEHLYKVVSGAICIYRVLEDGRRQVRAFYLPGEIFGLETGENHAFSAEAIGETRILAIKRSSLAALAVVNPKLARQLWLLTAAELQHVQHHILVLVMTARERVVGFLFEMAQRSVAGVNVDLPMTRQDIADYLGLRIETVSRTLTELEKSAVIARPSSHRIVMRDHAALKRLIC